VNDDTGVDAQVVLVIIASVVEGCQKVVGF
jgi:hypothetical protein